VGEGERGRERVGALRYFLASVYVCLTFQLQAPTIGSWSRSQLGDRRGGIAAARVSQRFFFFPLPLLPSPTCQYF